MRKSVKIFGEWSKPCGVAPLAEFFSCFFLTVVPGHRVSGIHIITGRRVRRRCKGNGSKHIKGAVYNQIKKFAPHVFSSNLMSCVTIIYFVT